MKVQFTRTFKKQLSKANTQVLSAFQKRLSLFIQNPHHPYLHNHALKGRLAGLRSINITGDWRALFSEEKESNQILIVFEVMGTHSQLYR